MIVSYNVEDIIAPLGMVWYAGAVNPTRFTGLIAFELNKAGSYPRASKYGCMRQVTIAELIWDVFSACV